MARRKKKGEPEMLIVSFCDIVTITTAAMFFAMLITVQEAVKIPVIKNTPLAKKIDKAPVFFECRSNEVFSIDLGRLQDQVAQVLSVAGEGARSGDMQGFLKIAQARVITNAYYRVDPNFLLAGYLALVPKPGAAGENPEQLEQANGKFQFLLSQLDPKTQYAVFLVRDDSFHAFRKARKLADQMRFDVGWELLDANEPIKFGTGGKTVGAM